MKLSLLAHCEMCIWILYVMKYAKSIFMINTFIQIKKKPWKNGYGGSVITFARVLGITAMLAFVSEVQPPIQYLREQKFVLKTVLNTIAYIYRCTGREHILRGQIAQELSYGPHSPLHFILPMFVCFALLWLLKLSITFFFQVIFIKQQIPLWDF